MPTTTNTTGLQSFFIGHSLKDCKPVVFVVVGLNLQKEKFKCKLINYYVDWNVFIHCFPEIEFAFFQ